jgi:hypothetical protein
VDGVAWEPHLAVDPRDDATVLAAVECTTNPNLGLFDAHPQVMVSRDGGASWRSAKLSPPVSPLSTVGVSRVSTYDVETAIGAKGEMYVLFGGPNEFLDGRIMQRLTLAVSRDHGAAWSYRTLHETSVRDTKAIPDYADFAVDPTSGDVYVVSDIFGDSAKSIWFWRSHDQGDTWVGPNKAIQGPGADERGVRIAAAAGHIVITAHTNVSASGTRPGWVVWRSADDGQTFSDPRFFEKEVASVQLGVQPCVWAPTNRPARIDVVYAEKDHLAAVRSSDFGTTWDPPRPIPQVEKREGNAVNEARCAPDGGLWVLERYGSTEPPQYATALHRLRPDAAAWQSMKLWTSTGEWDRGRAGGDYGGLTLAGDGSVWAAWVQSTKGTKNATVIDHLR